MADSNMQLQWTDEQWNKVRQVVYEEARRARVAGNFLPLYGPLEPDARFVARELAQDPDTSGKGLPGIQVHDVDTFKLSTLQVKVYLRGAQVADPDLSSALLAFRRAASLVARQEDDIIFRGQVAPDQGAPARDALVVERAPPVPLSEDADPDSLVRGGQRSRGLLRDLSVPPTGIDGNTLVRAVSKAIGALEERRHFGPFACVLDHEYFELVQTPNSYSLVLPQDRILPFLGGGTLVRSSSLPKYTGLVVALGGAPIDLVVATDISVNFLQVTLDARFVFRVFEKIVLRVKQPDAIEPLNRYLSCEPSAPHTAHRPHEVKRA